MKHGKKPTREQKKLMVKWKLDPRLPDTLRCCGDCKRLNHSILDGAAALCLYHFKTVAPWSIYVNTIRATFCRGFERKEVRSTMSNTREELARLIVSDLPEKDQITNANAAGKLADHLIANGVTIPESGRWMWEGRFKACSECGSYIDWNDTLGANHWKFCPYCGAKMDGKEEQNDGK